MRELFDTVQTIACPRYVSHRGFQPLAPANSLPSFMYAGYLRQWAIETDVHMTRDGILVCCHNDTVDATYDGTGAIREMSWAELSKLRMNQGNRLDCLTDGQKRMPLFSEYLAICKHHGSIPFIEMKTNDAELVVKAVHDAGLEEEEVIISAGGLEKLENVRRYTKRTFIHLIFAKPEEVETLASLGNAGLSWKFADPDECPPEMIAMAHDAGLKVCLRAGDSVESVKKMLAMGCDYVPTNCMHGELE